METGGTKHDTGKPDLTLLDYEWLMSVSRVMMFGEKKYARSNWLKGITTLRLLAACLRHVYQFLNGEDLDPESGEPHTSHASCCLMMCNRMWKDRPELDNRDFKAKPDLS